MDANQIFGILTVLFCSVGYFFAWKYAAKEKFNLALLLLILCGLAIRIYISTDFFLHFWDERYHALVAKHLMNHFFTPTLYENPLLPPGGYSWTSSHIWLHKQPLPLWAMAISMKLFGVNEIAIRIPSILLTTTGIGITYLLGKYFYNRKIGFVAAFLFSINGLIIELTGGRVATDHIDTFFLFFIELSILFITVYAGNRKAIYNILAAISLGAAILTKWLPALIVLPIWILILQDTKSFSVKQLLINFFVFLVVTTLVFLPWQIYIYQAFPFEANAEATSNLQHFTQTLDGQGGPFYYFIDKIRINYGELIYLPLLWFIWVTAKNLKDFKHLAIAIWIVIPIAFFSFAQTKMQGYIFFICPALFLMTAEFFYVVKESKLNKWLVRLLLFLLIALPIRYTIERMKPFEKIDRNPAWVNELKNLNKENITNGVLFNYKASIEAMFYTNLIVYPEIPDKAIIDTLLRKNYTVLINDDGELPKNISSIKGITKRHFLPIP